MERKIEEPVQKMFDRLNLLYAAYKAASKESDRNILKEDINYTINIIINYFEQQKIK